MIRLLLTYVLPLVAPTLLYLAWNWIQVQRARGGKRPAPPPIDQTPWVVLAACGILLVAVVLLSFVLFGGGSAPGLDYQPPRVEDGQIVPGQSR